MADDVHAEARAMFDDYLARAAALERHRQYAERVLKATSHPSGQTPVEPLATMGKGGTALLCDVCGKPMILEGGGFQGMHADEGWRKNPKSGWTSYISGGMVVQIESNKTLRIYHGYPNRSGCVLKAVKADDKARAKFREKAEAEKAEVSAKLAAIRAYLKAERPDKHNDGVMSDVYKILFVYDPGLGVNSPD